MAYFLNEIGFQTVKIRSFQFVKQVNDSIKRELESKFGGLKEGDVVVHQTPAYSGSQYEHALIDTVHNHKAKIIAFVHDVDYLRGFGDDRKEFVPLLNSFDWLIVSSHKIEIALRSFKVVTPMITCGPWDYLTDAEIKNMKYSKTVYYAGNLSKWKTWFLQLLPKDVHFKVYGAGLEIKLPSNAEYGDAKLPNDLPKEFNEGFGLVWDGDVIQKGVNKYGSYLQYNWSYKLSAYLSVGLPVIVWNKSNPAKFVEDNKIGITIGSLNELKEKLDQIDEKRYEKLNKNAQKVAHKIQDGYYIKSIVKEAIKKLNK